MARNQLNKFMGEISRRNYLEQVRDETRREKAGTLIIPERTSYTPARQGAEHNHAQWSPFYRAGWTIRQRQEYRTAFYGTDDD